MSGMFCQGQGKNSWMDNFMSIQWLIIPTQRIKIDPKLLIYLPQPQQQMLMPPAPISDSEPEEEHSDQEIERRNEDEWFDEQYCEGEMPEDEYYSDQELEGLDGEELYSDQEIEEKTDDESEPDDCDVEDDPEVDSLVPIIVPKSDKTMPSIMSPPLTGALLQPVQKLSMLRNRQNDRSLTAQKPQSGHLSLLKKPQGVLSFPTQKQHNGISLLMEKHLQLQTSALKLTCSARCSKVDDWLYLRVDILVVLTTTSYPDVIAGWKMERTRFWKSQITCLMNAYVAFTTFENSSEEYLQLTETAYLVVSSATAGNGCNDEGRTTSVLVESMATVSTVVSSLSVDHSYQLQACGEDLRTTPSISPECCKLIIQFLHLMRETSPYKAKPVPFTDSPLEAKVGLLPQVHAIEKTAIENVLFGGQGVAKIKELEGIGGTLRSEAKKNTHSTVSPVMMQSTRSPPNYVNPAKNEKLQPRSEGNSTSAWFSLNSLTLLIFVLLITAAVYTAASLVLRGLSFHQHSFQTWDLVSAKQTRDIEWHAVHSVQHGRSNNSSFDTTEFSDKTWQDVMLQCIDGHTAVFSAKKQMEIARNSDKDEIFLLETRKKDFGVETETGHDRKCINTEFITSPVNIEVSQPTGGTLGTKDLLQCALSDGDDTSIEDWCIDGTKPEKVCSTVDPTKYYDLYLEMSTLISYQILVPTKQTRGIGEFVGYLMKHGGSPTIDSIGEEFETTQDPAVEFTQLSEGKQYKSTLASILLARSAKIQQLVPQELVIQHILDYSPADRASKNVMSLWTAEFPANKQMAIARNDGKDEIFLPEIKEKDLDVETETGHDRKRKNMRLITSPVDIEITRCGNKHGCLKSSNDHGNHTDSDTRERTKQAENGGATASNEAGSSDHVPSSASGAEGSSGGDGDDGGSDKKVNCRSCADDDDDDDPVANEHEAPPLVVAVPKAIELKNQSEIQANNSEGSRNLICFQQFESWEIPEETFPHMIRTTLQPGIVKDPPQGIPSSTRLGELPMLQNSSSSIRANRLRDVDPELAEMFQRLNELDQPDEWNNQPSMDTTNQTPPVTSYHQGASDNPLVPDTALSFCDDLRMQQDQSDCPLQHNQLYFPFPQLLIFRLLTTSVITPADTKTVIHTNEDVSSITFLILYQQLLPLLSKKSSNI